MSKTIEQILNFENMMGVVETVKPGIPNKLPPAWLAMTEPAGAMGAMGKYTRVNGTRQTAQLVAYGAPSVSRPRQGVADVAVVLAHSFQHIYHDPILLQQLREYDRPDVQKQGMATIGRQTRDFLQLFQNLRLAAVYSLLANGAIYFDGSGNLLATSGGAVITADFGVPAGNKAQLDVFGTGAIIAASWATATTNIPAHIKNIKDASLRKTGYEVTTCYYGSNIFGYLQANNYADKIIQGNPATSAAFAQGEIPAGYLGIQNWIPIYSAFFESTAGVNTAMFGADAAIFTPTLDPSWYGMLEGTYQVPTNLSVAADAATLAASLQTVRGQFNYAQISTDPPTIKQMAGDTFLPVLKVPSAIFIADVTP